MERKQYRKCLMTLLVVVCGLLLAALYITFDIEKHLDSKKTNRISKAEVVPSNVQLREEGMGRASVEERDGEHLVIPCGYPIGVYVKTEGVMVIDIGCFRAKDKTMQSPCENILRQGDYITAINGVRVRDKHDLIEMVSSCEGTVLDMTVKRENEFMSVRIIPKQNENGTYMLGLWVKDDISGIGTLTYVDEDGFGALGHSINDNDTGKMFEISDGAIYDAKLLRIVKADGKHAGRLEGVIDYENECMLGRVQENGTVGIKGYLSQNGREKFMSGEWMAVAKKEEVHRGAAQILSWVSGEPQYYDVEIVDIFPDGVLYEGDDGDGRSKSIELRITDSALLELTSGIVQGLSGTPIIQDGKLVGAVTHVFLKDAAKGYGVFAEDMIK